MFPTYWRLLRQTQHARSRWCIVQCTPLHCNDFEFTLHLMIVGLLSNALFQYLKCQDQRISQNCGSTFIVCSSWNLWGGPFFTFSLPGGRRAPRPSLQLRHRPWESSLANEGDTADIISTMVTAMLRSLPLCRYLSLYTIA